MTPIARAAAAIIPLALASAAHAQPAEPRPELIRKLVECRQIEKVETRATCYDAQVDAFDRAEKAGQVVVVDRAAVKRTRRSLFGLRLPDLPIFGPRDVRLRDEAEFKEIEAVIKSARSEGERWLFELEDGALWRQSDKSSLARPPKSGQAIKIRKAAFGSFFANVDGQLAIRVKREN